MTKENTYNGWTNRETWLVNLWFGDSFDSMVRNEMEEGEYAEDIEAIEAFKEGRLANKDEYVRDMVSDMSERYEQFVDECLYEELEKLSGFISDFIDLGRINYYELAREVVREIFEV